jgi:hypothetical protein
MRLATGLSVETALQILSLWLLLDVALVAGWSMLRGERETA